MVKDARVKKESQEPNWFKVYHEDMESYMEKLIRDSDQELAKYFPFPPFTESGKNFAKFKARVAHLEARTASRR